MTQCSLCRNKQYVGEVIDGFFDDRYQQLIVGTKQNVLATINVESGQISWRRILEKGNRGSIQFVGPIIEENPNALRVSDSKEAERYAITVTGTTFVLVRSWNIKTGNLAWEWTFNNSTATNDEKAHWLLSKSILYHVSLISESSSLEISSYNVKTGYLNSNKIIQIPVPANQIQNCDFIKSFLVCSTNTEVVAIDLINGSEKVIAKTSARANVVNVGILFNLFLSSVR